MTVHVRCAVGTALHAQRARRGLAARSRARPEGRTRGGAHARRRMSSRLFRFSGGSSFFLPGMHLLYPIINTLVTSPVGCGFCKRGTVRL